MSREVNVAAFGNGVGNGTVLAGEVVIVTVLVSELVDATVIGNEVANATVLDSLVGHCINESCELEIDSCQVF